MSFSAAQGNFVNPTSVSTDSTLSVGFTPAAMIFLGSQHTADGDDGVLALTFGLTSGLSTQIAYQAYSQQVSPGGTVTNCRSSANATSLVRLPSSSTTELRTAQLKASTGWGNPVTVDWTYVASTQYVNHWLAFGGDGVTGEVGAVQCSSSASGTVDVTPAIGQPDVVMFFAQCASSTYPFTTSVGNSRPSVGWAVRGSGTAVAGQAGMGTTHKHNVATTDTSRRLTTDHAIWMADASSNALKVKVSEFLSNGFRVFTTAAGGAYWIYWVALKGVGATCGVLTQPTSTGAQVVTATGVDVKAVLLASVGCTAAQNDTLLTEGRGAFGWGLSSTARLAYCWDDVNGKSVNADGCDTNTYMSRAHAIRLMENATTLQDKATADMTSVGSESFTLDWESADATERQVAWLALGDPIATNYDLSANLIEPHGGGGVIR